jgi:transposase
VHRLVAEPRRRLRPSARNWLQATPSRSSASITSSLVGLIAGLNIQIAGLEQDFHGAFEQHPDAKIILSLPGLGSTLGARVLGEFGDDPTRYADARARRNYAGTSPITKASGTRRVVLARFARNEPSGSNDEDAPESPPIVAQSRSGQGATSTSLPSGSAKVHHPGAFSSLTT